MDDLAMTLLAPRAPLVARRRAVPVPGPGEVLLEVSACGVCRTDLHLLDGDLPPARVPIVPGHEVVGRISALGPGASRLQLGERVGVPWLGGACGHCCHCNTGRENLCDEAVFTGYHRDGGYALYAAADERFCLALPDAYDDVHAAPLLCAGLIGYRAYAMAPQASRLGLYGFGAAAHLIAQIAVADGREVFAFTRPGDLRSQAFARALGCAWAGASDEAPPVPLDAALLFAPVGGLVPAALAATGKAATVVCAGIHMSDIPSFPYRDLWEERTIRSVANLTRQDAREFLELAPRIPVRTEVEVHPLSEVNEALARLRSGAVAGSVVIDPWH